VTLPIRTRLAAWYVALLLVVLVGLGGFVVLRLRSDLTEEVDTRLDRDAAQIARAYEVEGLKDFHDVAGTVLPSGAGARLVDSAGRVVATHGAGEGGGVRYLTTRRVVTHGGRRLTLVTAESLAAADRAARRVLVLLLIGGAAAVLVTGLGGWWLARKALRPVERMTAQADRIGAESLDRRLDEPGTDDEVAHLARTLNAMLDRVDRGVEDKRRLVADASHELRGPLAVMRSELDVALAESHLAGEPRAVLESAREEVARMARMVDDMLALAAMDEGGLELVEERVDLHELAGAVAARLDPRARANGGAITVAGDRACVRGDALRLDHAVANFVDNALKFGPSGGTVRVETWRADGKAGVSVSDSGPGIREDQREQVFERFVRLDAARGRQQPGSGLGLAICHEVAVAHGGSVSVEPANGGGSRFTLALPAAP
jgi:heavy metal sensor kinase